MAKTHIILCVSPCSWGETAFGVHLARELHALGERVVLFGNQIAATLFRSLPFTCELVSEDLGRLFKLFLDTYMLRHDVASIVLADARGTGDFLQQTGCDPDFLFNYGIPIVALDTWSFSESGKFQDWFVDKRRNVAIDWLPPHTPTLAPVPFVRPRGIAGACRFLPARPGLASQDGSGREQFGIPSRDKVVLLCTAHWQTADYSRHDVHGARITEQIPRLLAHHFGQLGPSVHVVHVGNVPLEPMRLLGERYHWAPPLPQDEFDRLLAGVDLLLSLNVTSTAIGKAMVCNAPVLLLYSSRGGKSVDEICPNCPFAPTPFVKEWIERAVPLYPFFSWPLGMWRFLSPVLLGNPYMRTMETVEILDENGFVEKCNDLLTNSDCRESLLHEQDQYVAQVLSLPRPADLVMRFLGA